MVCACGPFQADAKLANTKNKLVSQATVPILFMGASGVDSNIMTTTLLNALSPVHPTYGGSGWNEIKFFNRTGSWTYVDQGVSALGLDVQHIETVDPAATFSIAGVGTTAKLHFYKQPGGGTFQYRFNGQAWRTVSTNSNTLQFCCVAVPGGQSVGTSIFKIRVLSPGSGLIFTGVDYQIPGGLRVHEIANGGMRSVHVANAVNTVSRKVLWMRELIAFKPCALIVNLGGNDQGANELPAQYAANMKAIKDCAQQAVPGLDVILMSNYDNNRPSPVNHTMAEYNDALLGLDDPEDGSFCVVDGFTALGPYEDNPEYWDNDTHLTDVGDMLFVQPIIDLFDDV